MIRESNFYDDRAAAFRPMPTNNLGPTLPADNFGNLIVVSPNSNPNLNLKGSMLGNMGNIGNIGNGDMQNNFQLKDKIGVNPWYETDRNNIIEDYVPKMP